MRSRLHLKSAVAAVFILVLISSGVGLAEHPFTDVPDGRFFSEAVDWAYNNGVTTGTSASTFEPDRVVTRGENITFAYRYDNEIVQPALDDIEVALADTYSKAEVDAAVGAVGGVGPAGPEGPEGPEGPQGPQGEPGFAGVYTVTANNGPLAAIDPPVGQGWVAICNAGDVVAGGGYEVAFNLPSPVRGSEPYYQPSPELWGWMVDITREADIPVFDIYAVCLDTTP